MSINFDSKQSHNDNNDGANISVSKKMHVRTIDATKGALATDQIEKSDSTYQEPYVPPAGSPELGLPDPYADTSKPKSAPSPQNAFLKKVQSQIFNLAPGQLASLGKGVTNEQAQAQLLFAFNHPDALVDPDVKNLLNQMTNNALASTQKQFNLPSSWQPNPPDTESADKQIGEQANQNFQNLAYSQLPMDKANKLIFQYYHPEFADPSDSALLNKLKGQSNGEIAEQEGLPDGWSMKPDSFAYDAKLDVFNDDAFVNHLNSDPETQNLSDKEKAELETLHHFPDADVPDKAKLKKFLAHTEQNAAKDTANKFNLPGGFKLGTGAHDYAATILGEFNTKFGQAVRHVKPPLSQAQMMKLLATGGVNSKNLSPELAALFTQLQGKTANDIADLFGLPKNWLQASKAADEAEGLSKELENGEEAEKTQGKDDAIGMAFPEVMRKLFRNRRAGGSDNVSGAAAASMRSTNYQAALNAIQLYQDGSRIFGQWANNLANSAGGSLNNNWVVCGDFTFAVTKALDKVRASVYQVQASEAQMSKKTSQMTTDNQATQNLISALQLKNQEEQQQANTQKNVFACFENIPGPLGIMAKLFETWVKTIFWVLDTVLGGALTAICNACGIQSLAENPLESLGFITAAQAATMDKDLQIIAQVVEILVEIVMAQPELIAASIASIAEDVAEVAVDVIINTVVKVVVKEAVEEGAEEVTEEAVKETLKDVVKEIVDKVVEQVGKVLSDSGRQALKESIVKAVQENISEIIESITDKSEEILKNSGQEAFEEGAFENIADKAGEIANKAADKGVEAAESKVSTLAEKMADEADESVGSKIKDYITKAAKMTGRDIKDKAVGLGEKIGEKFGREIEEEGEEGVVKGVAKAARSARMEKFVGISTAARAALTTAGVVKYFVQGGMASAANVLNGLKDLKLAQLAIQSGELDASMAELQADLRIMKKMQEAILDTLSNLGGWINDINKQENDFFKKAQIHFIAA